MTINPRSSYKSYGVACAFVWIGALAFVAVRRPDKLRTVSTVCGGWWLGWLSATIARSIYPPPQKDMA